MKYFDFHTHAFVDSLAERAVGALAQTSDIKPYTDGTVRGLLEALDKNGIEKALILPVATKPAQQKTINNWACEIMSDRLKAFGTIHPDAEDALEEAERIKSLGLYGVKFHSEYQFFLPDEEKMFPIYEKLSRLELPAVFHGGWDPYSTDFVRGTPERFARVAKLFPKLTIIVAHLGGMNLWDDVERYLAGRFDNVYLDVSVIAGYADAEQVYRIIKMQGADKVLFGSDCPWSDPSTEIALVDGLPLSEEEKELIFYKNAERLLKL